MLLSDNSLGLKFYPFKKDFLGVGVRGDDGEERGLKVQQKHCNSRETLNIFGRGQRCVQIIEIKFELAKDFFSSTIRFATQLFI